MGLQSLCVDNYLRKVCILLTWKQYQTTNSKVLKLSEYLLKNMADNQKKDADDLATALAEMEAKAKNWEAMVAARGQAREQIENEDGQQLDSEKKAMDKEDEALLASVAKKLLQDSVVLGLTK